MKSILLCLTLALFACGEKKGEKVDIEIRYSFSYETPHMMRSLSTSMFLWGAKGIPDLSHLKELIAKDILCSDGDIVPLDNIKIIGGTYYYDNTLRERINSQLLENFKTDCK